MSNETQPPEREDHETQLQRPEGESQTQAQPRIYVASLSDYNAGRLHGQWISADQEPEALLTAISNMLAASPTPRAEEWAIHDYEGFGTLRLTEFQSAETISALARGIALHGPAYAAWASQVDHHNAEELDRFADCYLGRWKSVETYAASLVDDLGVESAIQQAAGSLASYVRVDTEALARDMELGGDIWTVPDENGGVYLFSS
jgi:antirestriction protein